jgi:hypothetical protein
MGFFKKFTGAVLGGAAGFFMGGPAAAVAGAATGYQAAAGADKQKKAAKGAKREMEAQSQLATAEKAKASQALATFNMAAEAKRQRISARANQTNRRRVRGGLIGKSSANPEDNYSTSFGG